MKSEIYILTKTDIKPVLNAIPGEIVKNVDEDGYYTIGCVDTQAGISRLKGIAQFYVDKTADEELYSRLMYVYVPEEYRRQSVGMRLVHKADSILAAAGNVDILLAEVSTASRTSRLAGLSEDEQRGFLKECGFISCGDDDKQYLRFTGK